MGYLEASLNLNPSDRETQSSARPSCTPWGSLSQDSGYILSLGRQGMRRREFIGLLGGAAAAWPPGTGGQQRTQMRHNGFPIGLSADDPEGYARHAAFLQGLQELGWTVGRNLRMDYRSAAGVLENYPKYAAELIAAGSDVLVAGGTGALAALMQATRTLPM